MKIKRARGHRLYTVDSKKIIDLSMDRSRAVIGHRPNGISLTLKNSIDRGIYSSYDNIYQDRLIKYLRVKFPEYGYVSFLSSELHVQTHFKSRIVDPLTEKTDTAEIAYWRPFIDTPSTDNLIVLYPMPGLNTTVLLISKLDPGIKSERVSPIILAGILRSMYDYDLVSKNFKSSDFDIYNSIENSELKAPYLILNFDESEYRSLFKRAKENGILLNDNSMVQVLSTDFSKGERDLIIKVIRKEA